MSCSCSHSHRHKVSLIDVIKHNEETYSFDFEVPNGVNWHEGDSSSVYIPLSNRELGKKFSYATLPSEFKIRFTTRIRTQASAYKTALFKLLIGDKIEISAPTGHFKLRREGRPVVLLSNGVGIVAIRPHIKLFAKDTTGIPMLVQINIDRSDKLYEDEFKAITKEVNFNSFYEKRREDFYRTVDFELQNILSMPDGNPYIYVVGSDAFVKSTLQHLKNVGFSMEDIVTDGSRFLSTGCGCSDQEGCGCGSNLSDFPLYDEENIIK